MPKSRQRWVLKRSNSTKLPGSRSWSTRSRAVSLPSAWRLARRSSPPPSSASRFRRSSSARFSLMPMRWIFRRETWSLVCAPWKFKVARVDSADMPRRRTPSQSSGDFGRCLRRCGHRNDIERDQALPAGRPPCEDRSLAVHCSMHMYSMRPSPESRASVTRRSLRRREEDENPQLLGDRVKPMGHPRRREDDAARLHPAVLVAHANGRSAADDVIDLVLSVRLLRIDAASREDVQADAEGGPAEEFEIELAALHALAVEVGEFEGVHGVETFASRA